MEKKKVVIQVIICICVSAFLSLLIVNGIQIAMCDSLYYKLKTLEYEKHRLCYVLADNTSYEKQIDETKTRYILSMDMSFLKEASSDEETIGSLTMWTSRYINWAMIISMPLREYSAQRN